MTLVSSSQHHLEEDRVCGFYQSHFPALAEQQQRWQHGSTSAIVVAATRSCHQLSAPSHSHLSLSHTRTRMEQQTQQGVVCQPAAISLPLFLVVLLPPLLPFSFQFYCSSICQLILLCTNSNCLFVLRSLSPSSSFISPLLLLSLCLGPHCLASSDSSNYTGLVSEAVIT